MPIRNKYKEIAKLLKLDKPLIIFDIKTTGPGLSSDKIIEIAYIKIMPSGRAIVENLLLNPKIEVSELSISLHDLTNEDLKDEPTFREKANELRDIFDNCYYAGYNTRDFDLPFLRREFIRAGMDFKYSGSDIMDIRLIVKYFEPRTLETIYKTTCGKEHLSPHVAIYDIQVSAEILETQIKKYGVIRDLDFLKEINEAEAGEVVDKFYWKGGEPYLNFSRFKDVPLSEALKSDPGFYDEFIQNKFSEGNNKVLRKIFKNNKE